MVLLNCTVCYFYFTHATSLRSHIQACMCQLLDVFWGVFCRSAFQEEEKTKVSKRKLLFFSGKKNSQTLFDTLTIVYHSFGNTKLNILRAPIKKKAQRWVLGGGGENFSQLQAHTTQSLIFFLSFFFFLALLPELACVVTKSRITAKVTWTSLILRLTFHLIWVSMTARDVHGKVEGIHFFFFFYTQPPGATCS